MQNRSTERHQTKGIIDGDEIDLCWRVRAWNLSAVETHLSAPLRDGCAAAPEGDRDLEDIDRRTGFELDTICAGRAQQNQMNKTEICAIY